MLPAHKNAQSQPFDVVARHGNAVAHSHSVVWLGCALLVLLAVVAVSVRRPWDPTDELKYCQIVQTMQATGELCVPHVWGSAYADKPPLYFWLVLASAKLLGGVGLPALLAPSVLSACALLWLVFRIGSRCYGQRNGMLASTVLASLPLFVAAAQLGRMDMLFAWLIAEATYLFYRGYVEDHRWARVASFVCMGVAVLAKGPYGVLFPLATNGFFLAISGRTRKLWCRETVAGVFVLAGIVAAWLVPAVLSAGPGYLDELYGVNVLAAASLGLNHPQPAYFYLIFLPVVLFPWLVFSAPAIVHAWRRWRDGRSEHDLWLLCWIALPLAILSLVRIKLPMYLLPLMPAIALLTARYWSDLLSAPTRFDRYRTLIAALFIVASVAGLGGIGAGLMLRSGEIGSNSDSLAGLVRMSADGPISKTIFGSSFIIAAGGLATCLGMAGFFGTRQQGTRRVAATFGVLAAVTPTLALFLALTLIPSVDGSKSWRIVADSLDAARSPGEPVITYALRPYLGYHLNQDVPKLQEPDAVAQLVNQAGTVWCVVRDENLESLRRSCLVDFDPARTYPSPKGPVRIVLLRPLGVASNAATSKR